MKRIIKLVSLNIAVLLGFLVLLNISVICLYQTYHALKWMAEKTSIISKYQDPRIELPNYNNIEWAADHFNEFHQLPTEYRSFIGWRRLSFKGNTINIDSEGIRITPQHPDANESSPLVAFSGGSTMWGTGADDHSTIPAYFAEVSKGKFRALNLGEIGYNAYQGYLYLRLQMMMGLRPDIVVAYDGVNETVGLRFEERIVSHARENQIRDVMRGKDRERDPELSFQYFFISPLQAFIQRFKYKFLSRGELDFAEHYDLSQNRVSGAAVRLLESWLATKNLTETYGADFIAVLQPTAAIGNPKVDYLNLKSEQIKPYQSLYPEIIRLLQTEGYNQLLKNVVIMTEEFDIDDYIYIDFCHVSPNGNKIIAEAIFDQVEKMSAVFD